MSHDSSAPIDHYQFLEQNLSYSREEIDSWPVSNGFSMGDVLIIKGVEESSLKVGDVIVFSVKELKYPIIHRIVKIEENHVFTKGDNNSVIDNIEKTKIHGKAVVLIPYLGWPKVILNCILGPPKEIFSCMGL